MSQYVPACPTSHSTGIGSPEPAAPDSAKAGRATQALRSLGRVIVAFSGGIDSTLVLKLALDALGPENTLAATAVSPSLPQRELADVQSLCRQLGAPLQLIHTAELDNPSYAANPSNRCYYCKTELYAQLTELARQKGFPFIVNGMNADDVGDWRPGIQAAKEFGIRSPLLEAGLNKQEVRDLARQFGLPNWDKPAMACLSSRIQYGTPVTAGTLSQIEQAESFLWEKGFRNFRVRHHQKLARIEVMPADVARLTQEPLRLQLIERFKAIGYTYITLDLQGFRSGSGNETLASA